ncbi:unnamed protein product [Spirodela intermedia]|uniref:Nodulin-like domain-containing protein n=1 Tax=Spirodela intermedia TaxID=51605 RepID=A0A7I8IN85_SPIIN|nr:unnamed protein product [Spirodela intermedia]CAA6659024.1 unnamed protein product [Spirodela intermedia]
MSGSSYCFGIYSPLLKSSQGYDQSTLDSVAVFKDVGANAGLLSGLLYTLSSSGPWIVHAVGAAQCFAGYFPMWLAVTGLIPRPPVPLMCFYMFIAAHAQTFFNTANVVTAVQNFPSNRGTVVGIMKGFLGLSGAILIQIYRTMYGGRASNFLLMLALLPTVLPILLMCLVRVHQATSADDKQVLDSFSLVSLVVAATSCSEAPLASTGNVIAREDPSEGATAEALERGSDRVEEDEKPAGESSYGRLALSRGRLQHSAGPGTLDFWLLFLAMACGMGSGWPPRTAGVSVEHMELPRRFGGGFVSDFFLQLRGCARPLFMAITLATMSLGTGDRLGSLRVASSPDYTGSVLVGICYDCHWSLMPQSTRKSSGIGTYTASRPPAVRGPLLLVPPHSRR